jgi:hypothetical protein
VPGRGWIVTAGLATLAGFVALQIDGTGAAIAGVVLLSLVLAAAIGLIVARLGPQSGPDREREALAREEFDRTGRWPAE